MRSALAILVVWLVGAAPAEDPPTSQAKPPYERMLKGNDEKSAEALEKRIADLEEADQYAEAVKVAKEVAALRQRPQGVDHWQARDAHNRVRRLERIVNLPAMERAQLREADRAAHQAVDYHSQGKYTEAQPLYEKALDVTRQVFGDRHPDTATAYNNLALNLDAQGQYADAQRLFEKALAIKSETLGEAHPDTGGACNNLALNLDAQGQYADAQALLERALAIHRQVFGETASDSWSG